MNLGLSDFLEDAQLAARSLLDYGDALINPTVRLCPRRSWRADSLRT